MPSHRRPRLLGIDGGGSSTTALVEEPNQRVMFERVVGPTNATSTPGNLLEGQLASLLEGCPTPDAVAVCLAGLGRPEVHTRVSSFFQRRFPGVPVHLAPDYAAAFHCLPEGTHLCVIAGTGSLVCSSLGGERYATSGGKGYLLGDHGSAFRLGQIVTGVYVEDPHLLEERGRTLELLLGVGDRRDIVRIVHQAAEPAALLARAAPVLTQAAEDHQQWALELLRAEMYSLARAAARHITLHLDQTSRVRVGLVGGVWNSRSAVEFFSDGLGSLVSPDVVEVTRSRNPPVIGAVRVARHLFQHHEREPA